MKLIVGLGNPGDKYKDNRHNIGFMTVDEWAVTHQLNFNKTMFDAVYAEEMINGEKVLFVKPHTYMNLSGQAVRPLMNYFKIPVEDIVVIYDDMDLDVGRIRLRQKGSAGGHNGIKSMIECLGTNEFKRIKVGVGRPKGNRTVVSHVLAGFPKEEQEDVIMSVKTAVDAIADWLDHDDFNKTMNRYNRK